MGLFDGNKIKKLLKKIEEIKYEAQANGRFSLFRTKYAEDLFKRVNVYKDLEYFFELFEEYDESCKIPYEVGMNLDNLIQKEQVFIHRTNLHLKEFGHDALDDKILNSIMQEGLINNGHAMDNGGAQSDTPPSLDLTMSPLGDLVGYLNLVSPYKNSDTIVIASFPKDIIDSDGEPTRDYSDIYDLSGNLPHVKTEYMIGAIIRKDEGLWEYHSRDEIVKHQEEEHGKTM